MSKQNTKQLIIIGGPTASGKSSLAMDLAQAKKGCIINGDSLQVYKELPTLTSQPTRGEREVIPHLGYDFLTGDTPYDAASWARDTVNFIQTCWGIGLLPIVVGGTGFYLNTLREGLSPIPTIAPKVRSHVRACHQSNPAAFPDLVYQSDPLIAGRIRQGDSQRLMRAYEVFLQTKQSIVHWQEAPRVKLLEWGTLTTIKLVPPKYELDVRARERLRHMMANGALDEVRDLMTRPYGDHAPINIAIGFAQLRAHLNGTVTFDEALELTRIATAQYAKRQRTWFNHHFDADIAYDTAYTGAAQNHILQEVCDFIVS